LAFNAENQITQMDGGAAVYGYDGEGRRMKKTVGSETTYYFYGPGGLLCEFSTSNAISSATAASSTDRTLYRTSDKLGTAVLIMNSVGVVIENNRTLPYGESWLSEVASANDKKFTTYQRDAESGLDYAMGRYYGNTSGRFLSADKGPYELDEPASLNRYVYVESDPINFTDSTGNIKQRKPQPPPPPPPAGGGRTGTISDGQLVDQMDDPYYPTPDEIKWNNLSEDCRKGLIGAMPGPDNASSLKTRLDAMDRAMEAAGMLQAAVAGTNIPWQMLAAIGIRETRFRNVNEAGGGKGVGIFQIDLGQHPNVTAAQASDPVWAARYAAQLLVDNRSYILSHTIGLDGPMYADYLNWMVAASYNTGAGGQVSRLINGYNPDWHSAPMGGGRYRDDYGSNIRALQDCFK
jgi:RHS repeat-associated protein